MKGLYIAALLILHNFLSQGQNILFWSEQMPLQWGDFLGKVDHRSEFDAEAFTSVNYWYNFDSAGNHTFVVLACFNRTTSWIKQDRSCKDLLQHEQVHFSLAQLYARKLTLAFETFEYTMNFRDEIITIFKRVEIDYHNTQRLFDKETNHSLISEKEKEWEACVKEELKGAFVKSSNTNNLY